MRDSESRTGFDIAEHSARVGMALRGTRSYLVKYHTIVNLRCSEMSAVCQGSHKLTSQRTNRRKFMKPTSSPTTPASSRPPRSPKPPASEPRQASPRRPESTVPEFPSLTSDGVSISREATDFDLIGLTAIQRQDPGLQEFLTRNPTERNSVLLQSIADWAAQ